MVHKVKITQLIKDHPVIIFSKTHCPFCKKAKQAVRDVTRVFEVVELDEQNDGGEWQDILKEITGVRTVPQVFIGGEFIGGGDDTVKKHDDGTLLQLCTAAGARVRKDAEDDDE